LTYPVLIIMQKSKNLSSVSVMQRALQVFCVLFNSGVGKLAQLVCSQFTRPKVKPTNTSQHDNAQSISMRWKPIGRITPDATFFRARTRLDWLNANGTQYVLVATSEKTGTGVTTAVSLRKFLMTKLSALWLWGCIPTLANNIRQWLFCFDLT